MKHTRIVTVLVTTLLATLPAAGCAAIGEPATRVDRELALGCAAAGNAAGGTRDREPCEADPD